MPYTNPTTRSTGDVITAAQWNTDLVDNIRTLYSPPRCALYHSVNQSIATATRTALAFDSEHFDYDTMHNTAVNNTRITFTTAGTYQIGAAVRFEANATGFREVALRYNGATILYVCKLAASPTQDTVIAPGWPARIFGAGSYVELLVSHSAGVALNVEVAEGSPSFSAAWIGGV